MIKDYKGEMPKNVTTPEKAKAKKPFYKDWKFWVLTGLMTLFGACSIYGLVLGSQYVKAIERASHIIADANSSFVAESFASKKQRVNAVANDAKIDVFDMGDVIWSYWEQYGFFTADSPSNSAPIVSGSSIPFVCALYSNSTPYALMNTSVDMAMCINGGYWTSGNRIGCRNSAYTDPVAFKNAMAGVLVYYKTYDGYNGEDAYDKAFDDGYLEGHSEGYQEGYSDGSDAINVNQYFRVVMPVGNDSVQYESFLDGVADAQGTIVGGTTAPNYREFTRNRNQVLRVDLTLPSGYRAFWSYTPAFTASFPVDDNVSLQQSWAVDGVVYLPTWVTSVQIWVGVTSAQVPDLTFQTISVAFDVAHWGDIKVGAYQQGYQQGYVDGQQDPTAYQSGYEAGYSDGHDAGEVEGFNRGVGVGSSGSSSLAHMFRVAFQLPFDQLYAYLNFNLLGINFASLFSALITVSLGIIVIKKVL